MKKTVKIIFTILGLFFLKNTTLKAQDGHIKGIIIDKVSDESVPFATVVIKSTDITYGTSSDDNGKFNLGKLTPDNYTIVISYIGFVDTVIRNVEIKNKNQVVNLGRIYLVVNIEALGEVEISGINKTQVSKIDRKTYSAKDFKTTKGGNAADVLGKLPSVSVGPDGSVSVRGSSDFMVYLNGKPTNIDASTLLNQISSNDIDKIDIISVPTARYDAQGKGGIINIKTKTKGIEGFAATANGTLGGAPWSNKTDVYSAYKINDNRYAAGINLMYNTKKYSLYGFLNYNEKNVNGMRIGRARILVENDQTSPSAYFHMNAQGERPEWYKYYSANIGVDFYLSDSKELSFSYFYGSRNNGRAAYYEYHTFYGDVDGNVYSKEQYIYNPNKDNRYGDYNTASIDFTVDLEDGSNLILSGTYESSGLSRDLTNTNYFYSSSEDLNNDIETNYKNFNERNIYEMYDNTPLKGYRISVDYEKIFDDKSTLGVGSQVQYIGIKGDYVYDNEEIEVNDVEFDNYIDLDRTVYATYIDYIRFSGKWTYNFGLRTEYGNQKIYIDNTSYLKDFGLSDESNYYQTKLDLFPSAHINYQVNDNSKYILVASRRINRPSLTKMTPFLYRRHFEVYVIGDPNLESEYLNNIEFSYETNIGKQNINITGFYRGTENAVFRVNTTTTAIENESIHEILQEDVLIRFYTNAGNSTAIGGELTANLFISSWAKLLVGGSLYNFIIKGDVFGYAVDQESTNWSLKGNMNIDMSKETSVTFDYNYKSATVTSQGSNDYFQMANISFNYSPEKLEGWDFSLRGLDLLSSNLQYLDTNAYNKDNQQIFYQETEYHRNGPIVELGVTYTFNNVKSKKVKKASAEDHFK
ncbi:TonB-dependent receptor [Flavicella sp.]|uniref:TonB-dependent receptor n=1 Tax=Flavicella sp. TaxID=2957742 RepID=UPI00301888AB